MASSFDTTQPRAVLPPHFLPSGRSIQRMLWWAFMLALTRYFLERYLHRAFIALGIHRRSIRLRVALVCSVTVVAYSLAAAITLVGSFVLHGLDLGCYHSGVSPHTQWTFLAGDCRHLAQRSDYFAEALAVWFGLTFIWVIFSASQFSAASEAAGKLSPPASPGAGRSQAQRHRLHSTATASSAAAASSSSSSLCRRSSAGTLVRSPSMRPTAAAAAAGTTVAVAAADSMTTSIAGTAEEGASTVALTVDTSCAATAARPPAPPTPSSLTRTCSADSAQSVCSARSSRSSHSSHSSLSVGSSSRSAESAALPVVVAVTAGGSNMLLAMGTGTGTGIGGGTASYAVSPTALVTGSRSPPNPACVPLGPRLHKRRHRIQLVAVARCVILLGIITVGYVAVVYRAPGTMLLLSTAWTDALLHAAHALHLAGFEAFSIPAAAAAAVFFSMHLFSLAGFLLYDLHFHGLSLFLLPHALLLACDACYSVLACRFVLANMGSRYLSTLGSSNSNSSSSAAQRADAAALPCDPWDSEDEEELKLDAAQHKAASPASQYCKTV